MTSSDINQVALILSVGSIIGPMVFGFALWKMSRFFVNKEEFGDYKKQAEYERHEASRQLERIADNVNELLKAVARMQGHRDSRPENI